MGNGILEKSLSVLSGSSQLLAMYKKSVVEREFFDELAFDNKTLKTFDEFRICWKPSKFECCRIQIWTSSHPYLLGILLYVILCPHWILSLTADALNALTSAFTRCQLVGVVIIDYSTNSTLLAGTGNIQVRQLQLIQNEYCGLCSARGLLQGPCHSHTASTAQGVGAVVFETALLV